MNAAARSDAFESADALRQEIWALMGECALYGNVVRSYVELRDDAGVAYAILRQRESLASALRHFKQLMTLNGVSIGEES